MQNHWRKKGSESREFIGLTAVFSWRRWRPWGSLALFLLFICVGVIWCGWASGRDAGTPGVLKEAEFQEVTPYLFRNDKFYFRGKTENSSGYYIFDLKNDRLKKVDWTGRYGDARAVHQLSDGVKVQIREDQSGQSLILERDHRQEKVVDTLPLVNQPVSVSPKGNTFVYADKARSKLTLHLYTVRSGRVSSLKSGVEETSVSGEDWVKWSADGRYLLIENEIYRSSDGKRVHTLSSQGGVWSAEGARLAYITAPRGGKSPVDNAEDRPTLLGDRIIVLHPDSGKSETLYRTEKGRWIVGQPVWDPAGRYLAFPIGKEQGGETFFEEVHVTDGKLFHYTENEQNLLSTRLKHLTLSPGGDYLCYAVNGILKLVDLRTLESRVYDVYNQVQSDPEYVRFDPGGVWLAQNQEILFVKDNMEEKRVYRSRRKVLSFYLSGHREKLLVREETANGQILKLIDLKNWQQAQENNS